MFKPNAFKIPSFRNQAPETPQPPVKVESASCFESLFSIPERSGTLGDLSARKIRAALENAREGFPREQIELLDEMLEREPHMTAHWQTRQLSVAGKNWSVSSKRHPEIAEAAGRVFASINLQPLIAHLMTANLYGYACVVTDWQEGGVLKGVKKVHPGSVAFESDGHPLFSDVQGALHRLDSYAPAQFIFANAPGTTGAAGGLGRNLLWLWLLKKNAVSSWARFVEKFGLPMLMGKLPQGTPRTQVNELLNALMKMAHDGVGVATGNESTVETIECGKSGNDQEAFCRYADEMSTLVILGQLATSGRSSGLSEGNIQGAVRQDLMGSDASMVINAVQNQLLNPWVRMNFGLEPHEHDITFWIDFAPPQDLLKKAELCLKITAATGCKLDRKWAEEQFGILLSPDE